MVKAVQEPWGEPEGVEHRVEEAGVAKVTEGGDGRRFWSFARQETAGGAESRVRRLMAVHHDGVLDGVFDSAKSLRRLLEPDLVTANI